MESVDFTERYKKLNARQKEAVDTTEGPLMVVAGPGTGKTELLSMRAANILRTTDTLAENILCLTFTESGAAAMRERLSQIIGPDAYKVAIHTFHSFGSDIISRYGEYFYHGANFRPASELNSYEVLRAIFDSLDLSNPLSSKMNGEYTHLADSLAAISDLKKSGLTSDELLQVLDANEAVIDNVESELRKVFANRISKGTAAALAPTAKKLADFEVPELPPGISPLANVLALSLAHAIDSSEAEGSTKPITAWKNAHLEKNEEGQLVFKDRKRNVKLRALSYLYYQYLLRMQESELYDFDDMVLRVVHALEVFPDLRYNLQEKYLYIMVDEFQDTNLAQARILHNLTSIESGDEPNIMVVGDDDQAIYSFQGAEVGNILSFKDRYESVRIVTLTDNYRSAEPILEKARSVITQGTDRLERYLEEIDKTLASHHSPKVAQVKLVEYARIEDERRGIAERIKAQIDAGINGHDIAVLARRHHELVSLLPYFYAENIPVNYERHDNVLDADIVVQLVLLAKVVCHIADGQITLADELMPQLLAHPAWGLSANEIWKLSLSAHTNHSGWLQEMETQPRFTALFDWLVSLSREAMVQPAELVIDQLVGSPNLADDTTEFTSPLYHYFFAPDKQANSPAEYLVYLEALRTIRAKLREYRPNQALRLSDFIEFVELHQQIGSGISSIRVRSENLEGAVNLMTVHRSKGLEFAHVHIAGAVDSSWGERVRVRSRLIGYPENLPLRPTGDTIDERLRLFFVAMTRARSTLSISYARSDEAGKPLLPASFLTAVEWDTDIIASESDVPLITKQLQHEWYQPLLQVEQADMKSLLKPVLQNYKLSATHLLTFLDVSRGGPQNFLISQLLHFPSSMSPSAAYGSAVHRTLHRAHAHLASTGKRKPVEDVLQDFEKNLAACYLADEDFQAYLQKGQASLEAFLAACYESFTASQQAEVNFVHQQSTVGEALLTGALDVIDVDEDAETINVTDYKTGKPAAQWRGTSDWEKIKLHKYKQQLLFYKLLIEQSRDFGRYSVPSGTIQFVEPTVSGAVIQLDTSFDTEEYEQFKRLVRVVYRHITSLDLPDAGQFSPDYKGILDFEAMSLDEPLT